MNNKKLLIFLGAFIIIAPITASIELPLPDGVQKVTTTKGRIKFCDIEGYGGGKAGKSFLFVGIQLMNNDIPYLRWNTEKSKRNEIKAMCEAMKLVEITYTAKRKLIRPKTTYWIEAVHVFKT